jgi:hypothetical protein
MKAELEPGRRAERSGAEPAATGCKRSWPVRDVRPCARAPLSFSASRAPVVFSWLLKLLKGYATHRIVGRIRHDVCFAEHHVPRAMAKLGSFH